MHTTGIAIIVSKLFFFFFFFFFSSKKHLRNRGGYVPYSTTITTFLISLSTEIPVIYIVIETNLRKKMRSTSSQRSYQRSSTTSKSDRKAAASDNEEDKEESDDDMPLLERITVMKEKEPQSSMGSVDNVMDQDSTESQKSPSDMKPAAETNDEEEQNVVVHTIRRPTVGIVDTPIDFIKIACVDSLVLEKTPHPLKIAPFLMVVDVNTLAVNVQPCRSKSNDCLSNYTHARVFGVFGLCPWLDENDNVQTQTIGFFAANPSLSIDQLADNADWLPLPRLSVKEVPFRRLLFVLVIPFLQSLRKKQKYILPRCREKLLVW